MSIIFILEAIFMFLTNGLANLKKSPLAAISQYASHGRRMFVLPMLGLALTACQGEINVTGDLSDLGLGNINVNGGSTSASNISGSVGDGPIINAQINITDSTGAVIGTTVSDTKASYNIFVPAGTVYPLVVTATGGTDVVTYSAPDFTLLSYATNTSINTVNINPFSTLIVKTAQAMPGGLTSSNTALATASITEQLSFGLDPALVANPITTSINEANVASIIKSSEALGEAIRRTRTALLTSGSSLTEDQIIDAIAADMTDGILDGRGPGASARIAATTNIVSGQVLVEAMANRLNVGGADATTLMDMAINLSVPSASMSTSDVVITNRMLRQTRTALAATQSMTPNANLSALAVVLASLSGNSTAADIDAALPANPESAFEAAISQVALSTSSQQELVNATMRSAGTFMFAAPTYTVGENEQVVNLTINRVGSSVGTDSIEWRTRTFDGYGTADWSNDYGTVAWTPLTFSDGQTSKVISVVISDDTSVEGDETFTVQLQDSTGSVASETIVTIIDDVSTPAPAPAPAPAQTSQTADYYVATSGSNTSGDGSINNPYATLSKVFNVVKPGDLVYIRGGVYDGTVKFTVSGTASNPITYQSYPGEKAIFDGSKYADGTGSSKLFVNTNWNVIKDIEVRNNGDRGIWIVGNDNVIENVESHHNYFAGVQIYRGDRNLLVGLDVHNNLDDGTANGGKNGGNSDGIKIDTGSNNIIRNSESYLNGDDGIDVWHSTNTIVEGCYSHNNGRLSGDGNGFKLGGLTKDGVTFGGHTVIRSIAANNRSNGFDWNGSVKPLTLYNNTAYSNGSRNYVFNSGTGTFKNNISYAGNTADRVNVGVNTNNTWNLNISNPQFVSVNASSADFLKPSASSVVIDKGAHVGTTYKGAAPDLGAIEVK